MFLLVFVYNGKNRKQSGKKPNYFSYLIVNQDESRHLRPRFNTALATNQACIASVTGNP